MTDVSKNPVEAKEPKCANPECDKPSGKLICPNCKETKKPLNVSSFCSQECFKTFWPIHKLTHEFHKQTAAAGASEKKTTKA